MSPSSTIRLTQQVKAGGCASKLSPGSLAAELARLPMQTDANMLVGFNTSDDAGVYRIAPNLALVPGSHIAEDVRALWYDPQTAGGLLIAVAAAGSSALLQSVRDAGVPAVKIGEVSHET